jgi:hypothetical protein
VEAAAGEIPLALVILGLTVLVVLTGMGKVPASLLLALVRRIPWRKAPPVTPDLVENPPAPPVPTANPREPPPPLP